MNWRGVRYLPGYPAHRILRRRQACKLKRSDAFALLRDGARKQRRKLACIADIADAWSERVKHSLLI